MLSSLANTMVMPPSDLLTPPEDVFHFPSADDTRDTLSALDTLHPSSAVSPMTTSRQFYRGAVSLRGVSVMAFCKTITTPGLEQMAHRVRFLKLKFDDAKPSSDGLKVVAAALRALTRLEELTVFGLPSPLDGWIFKDVTFSLTRFISDMCLSSNDVVDFLSRQTQITELGTTSFSPSSTPTISGTLAYNPFRQSIVPKLNTLDCPAQLLLSILLASPPVRPITHLRVDFDGMSPLVETDALSALSLFNVHLRSLSLRRTVTECPAASSRVGLSTADVIDRIAERRRWSQLRFLEIRDGTYDFTAMPAIQRSISAHFPSLETLVWAPSGHEPSGELEKAITASYVATVFFTFCGSLQRFVFLEPDGDDESRYVAFNRHAAEESHEETVATSEVESMWRVLYQST